MPSSADPGLSLWVALAVAVVISAFLVKSRLNYLAIPIILPSAPGAAALDCLVVIPARNEEASIGRAVRSFPPDTVIVVDDHSEDGTAEEARRAGAGVLPAPELPRGAIGKSNACRAGARVLTSRWVLFADADTWFEPGFLDAVVAWAAAKELSFLSVHLQPECATWTERLLVPVARALYFCGVSPRGDPTAVFSGQCLLVRRQAYEFIGGHSAVLSSLAEDVKLAALARRHRLKFGVARAPDLGHARVPAGLREILAGFNRQASRFTVVSPWIGASIMIATWSLALWLPALAWLLLDRRWLAACAFALLPSALLWSWYGSGRQALLAPVAIYGMLLIVCSGFIAAVTGRPVEWKGRTI